MKKVDAKVGYDQENRILDIYFSPTLNVDNHKTIVEDAKVVFNLAGDELADIKIMLPKDYEFLKQYGEGSGCSVCLTLMDLDQELDEVLKGGSLQAEKGKEEEKGRKDELAELIKILLLID